MTEKLVSFLLLGILVALGYHLAFGLIQGHFFPASSQIQGYWFLPHILVPAALLLALAWGLGFYRRLGWADIAVTLILIAIVGLTIPASYSCGSGCF